jgi:GH15 family glucan-1,4-alpha-glucosidase
MIDIVRLDSVSVGDRLPGRVDPKTHNGCTFANWGTVAVMAQPTRIEELGFLSDCRSAALVDRCGSVVWWCPERFDSDSWFGSLVGSHAGVWTLEPLGSTSVHRRYLPGTLVLETTFSWPSASLRLTEALLVRWGSRGRQVGRGSPGVLARLLECLDGKVEVSHVFEPAPGYGATHLDLNHGQGLVEGESDGRKIALEGEHGLRPAPGRLEETLALKQGDVHGFVCGALPMAEELPGRTARALIDDTALAWRSWNDFRDVPGGAGGDIAQATIVLKGLTHADTGALVAAPTTSLPEIVGQGANWDYRYGWLRDSSLFVNALLGTSCSSEVEAYFAWMRSVAFDESIEGETQAVFGIGGERDLVERTLDHLDGFQQSTPVRVGNGAHAQRQLDIYGHVLDAATQLAMKAPLSARMYEFLAQLVNRATSKWQHPDHGLWERRDTPQRYSSSMLMCWVAVGRALALPDCGSPGERTRWASARNQIESALWQSWDELRQVFPSYEGAEELDASALLFVLMGFLGGDDPRATALIAGLEAELGDNGLLVRWTGAGDGAFLLCSFWLVEALVMTGQPDRAAETLAALERYRNDIGLLPEEVDISSGEALGNTPLALSHAGYICAKLMVEQARHPSGASLAMQESV